MEKNIYNMGLKPKVTEGLKTFYSTELESKGKNDFRSITEEMIHTYEAKNHDYGNSFEESLDKFGLVASAVRLSDKINRFNSLIAKDSKVKNESIQDTLLDMANYAVMTLLWLRK